MEAISSSTKLNKVSSCPVQRSTEEGIKQQVIPENPSRNMGYVDSRCLHLLNPEALLNVLPKQISNPKVLEQYIAKNPQLKSIIEQYGLDIKAGDYENFLKYTDEHMKQTSYIAGRICDGVKKPVDKPHVVKAARLHDIGKIFIPSSILNKPENLTPEEKKVMDVHSDLGYELLRTLKFDPKTLKLIKNHHSYGEDSSLEQQIVSAADVYAALTEKRPYKTSIPHQQAIEIMKNKNHFSDDTIETLSGINN